MNPTARQSRARSENRHPPPHRRCHMKVTVRIPTTIEIKYIRLIVPVRHGDEVMPYDFPGRTGDTWDVTIDVDTGEFLGWPKDMPSHELYMKVTDEGIYQLLTPEKEIVAKAEREYVPDMLPNDYGDYLSFTIENGGIHPSMLDHDDIASFFGRYTHHE